MGRLEAKTGRVPRRTCAKGSHRHLVRHRITSSQDCNWTALAPRWKATRPGRRKHCRKRFAMPPKASAAPRNLLRRFPGTRWQPSPAESTSGAWSGGLACRRRELPPRPTTTRPCRRGSLIGCSPRHWHRGLAPTTAPTWRPVRRMTTREPAQRGCRWNGRRRSLPARSNRATGDRHWQNSPNRCCTAP